jgi:hypothetical protein
MGLVPHPRARLGFALAHHGKVVGIAHGVRATFVEEVVERV